jgi:CubicO group peptidase (beta-lactamase class C family)
MKKTVLLFLTLAFSGGTYAQTATLVKPGAHKPQTLTSSPVPLPEIDQLLQEYTADNRVPGAIALIAHDGKIVYRKAVGLNDTDAKTALTPDAIFRIASQTKAITSIGLMLLYEQAKFQLDDPISKYLPAFRNLHHRTGQVGNHHPAAAHSHLGHQLSDNWQQRS